ncbi:MAG: hypothetical protein K5890_06955, partial [Bacteroidales bacterium]|nr:hypothetical protein [Bacteroidales bacterium]
MSLRGTAVMGALMLAAVTFAKTPDLNGVVLDEKNEPMPFVNVVLISLPDSAYVQGGMTDEMG